MPGYVAHYEQWAAQMEGDTGRSEKITGEQAELGAPEDEQREASSSSRGEARRGALGAVMLGVMVVALTAAATRFARRADTAPASPSPVVSMGAPAPAAATDGSGQDSIFFLIFADPPPLRRALRRDEVEGRARAALERSGFYTLGVSASRSGDLYVAGPVYSDAEVREIKRIASRVPGVARAHFLHPEMQQANGPPYFGARVTFAPHVWGAEVVAVTIGSPAQRAGIVPGDIIKQFGGATVGDATAFARAIAVHTPGDRVKVGLRRAGSELFLIVRLEDMAQIARN